ncbi:BlaI/MecI/CopY family transcriptional regulator [Nosocomiicoccus massiliensis]|uniref:BlaI/MecI/CopY family transcriptional regulator n=1 Tax=Nosocomiicoccus massiliensis TaxID=1232430 RepID=A0AAF1BR93_9STAP|nr:BlaI/MecI/CopY family transcriptional regulator [Nosocomiicoccus massiliensis]WOS95828.1 BlaI/MecI/CopY family transcriptional regulator [Nosocomiicoccus massiliensis]
MKDILKILEKIRGENLTKAIDSNITNSEWEVMRVVWAQNKTTSKDIRDIMALNQLKFKFLKVK